MLQAVMSRVRFPMRSLDSPFPPIDIIIPAALCPGVDSASNRNEYHESSWEGKGRLARKADNLTAICEPIV
jgi:hypothetical protein